MEALANKLNIHHHYQPIFDIISWKKCGYEVLFRSSFYENPLNAFADASKEKKLFELDTCSLEMAITGYFRQTLAINNDKLYANVFPSTLVDSKFISFIENGPLKNVLSSLVLEISETETLEDLYILKNVISFLKEKGVKIALDDFGKGQEDFRKLIELKPDILKLDKYFSAEIEKFPEKQEIVKYIVAYCKQFNIRVILEGLETPIELATAKALGINYAQGYILGKPKKLFEE